jgi:hypothetical protein
MSGSFNGVIRTKSVPVVLYGCETWSLTFREEHRLSVLVNRGRKRLEDEEKYYRQELHDLYCSSNVIQVKKSRMRWVDMWHA